MVPRRVHSISVQLFHAGTVYMLSDGGDDHIGLDIVVAPCNGCGVHPVAALPFYQLGLKAMQGFDFIAVSLDAHRDGQQGQLDAFLLCLCHFFFVCGHLPAGPPVGDGHRLRIRASGRFGPHRRQHYRHR